MPRYSSQLPSNRQLRVAELIRHSIAEELLKGFYIEGSLSQLSITVTEVKVSPDLKKATAFIIPLAGKKSKEIISALDNIAPRLQGKVSRSLGLRHTPEIKFENDSTFDNVDRIESLLKKVSKKQEQSRHE
tara:strand:+ start:716 stop:1108 length:393 start_codon:yes stop_codon:yes gene_type:complete